MLNSAQVAKLYVKIFDDTTLAMFIRCLLSSEEAEKLNEDETEHIRKLLSDLGDVVPDNVMELAQSI
jgi:hypothetical protein